MTDLSGSLLALRSAYGGIHRKLLEEGLASEAHTVELIEGFVEGLPPEALSLSATQAVIDHLLNGLPGNEWTIPLERWLARLGVHLYHLGARVHEPLYSRLFGLRPVETRP
jgi:hypothetical protein